MMITYSPITRKALVELIALAKSKGNKIPASHILCETSMFGPEIKPNTTPAVCLNHPKRTTFAVVILDSECNIVGVKK